jgi:two-component system LytT family response regulator
MIFKAVIIEDEILARETLTSYLARYFPDIKVMAEIDNINEAVNYLNEHVVDILFIDVHLKDGKSLEILKQVNAGDYKIIFTTAHDNYALEAFKNKAFGYLLKPIDPIDFKEIVGRVLKDLMAIDIEDSNKKIKVPTNTGYIVLDLKDIIRCEAESNYTKIFTKNNSTYITVSKTLKYVEQELIHSKNFIRIHQSHLINTAFVKIFEIKNNFITLTSGDKIPVSRAKRNSLLDDLQR